MVGEGIDRKLEEEKSEESSEEETGLDLNTTDETPEVDE